MIDYYCPKNIYSINIYYIYEKKIESLITNEISNENFDKTMKKKVYI